MAKRLNKKIALIGSLLLVIVLCAVIFLGLKYSKDPLEYINDAEELLAKVTAEIESAVASNDFSKEKQEAIGAQYRLVQESYRKAYGCARDVDQKVEILFTLAELFKIDNAFHPMDWKKLPGCWTQVTDIAPKHVGARMNLLKYYYEAGDSRSQVGGGSGNPVWRTVETTATYLINVLKDTGMEEDVFVLKAKARATLEIVTSGQTTNAEKSTENTIVELRYLQELSPSDADIYLYLARAHWKLGILLSARTFPNALKSAKDAQYAVLTEGLELAENRAKIEIALLNLKATQVIAITDKDERIQKMKELQVEYEELVKANNTNAEVYTAHTSFYMLDNSLSDAIITMEKAVALDEENVQYARMLANYYYYDFSINKNEQSLRNAIKTSEKASNLPDAKIIPGPREQLGRVNYYSVRSLQALLQTERAILANKMGNAEEKDRAISEMELLIHDIKQYLTENKVIFAKWDGLLAMVKGDNETAIRELFTCYEIFNATENVDTFVSYILSQMFAKRPEIGARLDFLANALFNHYKNKYFVSIAATKPEALLDYAEILLRLREPARAIAAIDLFDENVSVTERSKQTRVLAYINNRQLDDAKTVLSELDAQTPETISLKIDLLTQQIAYLSGVLKSEGSSSVNPKSPDGETYSQLDLEKYRKERVELIKTLLKLRPELVSTPIGVCRDLLRSGDKVAAQDLIDAFLKEHPENMNSRIFRRFLAEPDPLNVAEERHRELRIAELNDISDDLKRHVELGFYYTSVGELDLSQVEFEKVLEIQPGNKKAVSALFDIAVSNQDIPQATKLVGIAREYNLDGCNGEFYAGHLDILNDSLQNAINRLDTCLEVRPLSPYVFMLKSRIYVTLKDYDKAVEMAESAAKMNPLDGTLARQAVIAIQARNAKLGMNVSSIQRKELETILARAITLNPTDWQLQVGYSRLVMDKEPNKAIAIMQDLMKRFPNLETNMQLGMLAMELAEKEIDKKQKAFYHGVAGVALEKAYTFDSRNDKVLDIYSEYLRITGRHEDAKRILIDRQDIMWQFHIRDGQFEKAKDILLARHETNPKDSKVLQGLAKVSLLLKDKESLKRYTETLLAVDKTVDNELLQIQYFLETKLFEEADLKLASFKKRHKDEPRALMLEAWSRISKGKIDEARTLINETLAVVPENAVAWRLRGQINMLSGNLEQAIKDLQESMSIDVTSSVQLELANAYRRSGNMNEAIGLLVQAVKDDRASLDLWAMLETFYIEAGRRLDLGQFYTQVLKKYPESVHWLSRSGNYAFQAGRFQEAEKRFLKSWKLSNETVKNMSALDGYLGSLRKLRKHKAVIKYAQQYINTESAPVAYLNMANSELYLGNRQKAIECYNEAIEKSNKDDDLIFKLLREMSKALGPQDVTKWCNKRLQTEPDLLPANLMLCILAQENRDFDEALHYADIALRLTEGQERDHLMVMDLKAKIFITDYMTNPTTISLLEAIKVYESMLVIQPNNSNVMNNLAYLYIDNNQDTEKAVDYAKKSHKMSPTDANKMDTYAYALCKIGKYEQAEQLLQEAINLFKKQNNPIGWEIFYHLGIAQEGLEQYDDAIASYKLAIEKSEGKIAKKNIEKLRDALSNASNN
ncbi:MAG: tetratricopeptide repeat protein [Planctomycetes bacterium]|nr:tetratricopeptide repeat protein [Planctomycetota bacterium]